MEELPAINLPTPMTPETRKLIRTQCFDADKFLYGNHWLGTAAYYKAAYPGFDDDHCKAMEAFSAGVTPKQYRNILKKEKRKQQQAACSGSRLNQSSSSAHPSLPAINPSTNK
jgi:hypothetical protein